MKNINLFYLFLLGLIAVYFFNNEIKKQRSIEGFLTNTRKHELYDKYQGDFKQSNIQFGDFSNDLDLFVQATDTLIDKYSPDTEPSILPGAANIEINAPEEPKGENMGISNPFDIYDVEPKQDLISALQDELNNVTDKITYMQDEPYVDEELLNELKEEQDGINQMIIEETYNQSIENESSD